MQGHFDLVSLCFRKAAAKERERPLSRYCTGSRLDPLRVPAEPRDGATIKP